MLLLLFVSKKGGNHYVTISPSDKRTVLIVDDDTASREALAHLLQEQGYRASQAENGLQAMEQLEVAISPPELILLDLDMPVMNGREIPLTLSIFAMHSSTHRHHNNRPRPPWHRWRSSRIA
jgi:PleD family two-component response regulator